VGGTGEKEKNTVASHQPKSRVTTGNREKRDATPHRQSGRRRKDEVRGKVSLDRSLTKELENGSEEGEKRLREVTGGDKKCGSTCHYSPGRNIRAKQTVFFIRDGK